MIREHIEVKIINMEQASYWLDTNATNRENKLTLKHNGSPVAFFQ